MNTDLQITIRLDRDDVARREVGEAALDRCADWLATFERTCSRFLAESELSALNAAAGATFAAGELLFAVVARALAAAAETNGLFDPTILPALQAAGYTRSFDEIGHREIEPPAVAQQTGQRAVTGNPAERRRRVFGIAPGRASSPPRRAKELWRGGRWRGIRLDHQRLTITLPAGVALDLGGIAKGWAADELARRILSPFPAYLIDLGGDLRVHSGPEPGEPWIIGIADPRAKAGSSTATSEAAVLAGIPLASGGIATSGDARRWWLRGGARQHHLIDPRTGRPALPPDKTGLQGPVLAWTALATTATEADVLAKVAYLRGYPDGLRSLTRGTGCAGLCVFANGELATSANLKEYLDAHAAVS